MAAASSQVPERLCRAAAPAAADRESAEFFDTRDYEDFSFWKVFLGYSIPTLAAVGLATWCFCRRDL